MRHPAANQLGRAPPFETQGIDQYGKVGAGEEVRIFDPDLGKAMHWPADEEVAVLGVQ